jgi:hypothetical protein
VEAQVKETQERRARELAAVRAAESRFIDALEFYYAHRLDRAHLRADGSQHLRYRRALRQLRQAIAEIPNSKVLSPEMSGRTEVLRSFASGFLTCAARAAPPAPPAGSTKYMGYRHLSRGIEHLDAAVCNALLPGLRRFGEPVEPGGRVSLSYHELMAVLTQLREQPWIEEAVLRMNLLNAFSALMDSRAGTS